MDTEKPKRKKRSSKALVTKATEGQYRVGPYALPVSGGFLDADVGSYWNFWQMGYNVESFSPSAIVEACVSAYSQTVAMCPGNHWLTNADGGRERITTSLCRVLRQPNAYQSISDFLLNAVRMLFIDGNAYALALRNNRFEIEELHLMNSRQCAAQVAAETGDVFYSLGGNPVIERQLDLRPVLVPSRDVLHLRLNTSAYNPLMGESPIVAAMRDIAVSDAVTAQQIKFYMNQARPSFALTTDMTLDASQLQVVRDAWDAQAKKLNSGGVPILTSGIKPVTIGANATDSQLAEILKMTQQNIALAYRVPLQILGIGGSPVGSTEAQMQWWLSNSLGFVLNHIEEALGNLFQLVGQPDEYIEFDTDALLRSAMKDRVEAFARGVQGGIFEPDYARAQFGLPKVKGGFGAEPRVQQQLVPLSAASAIPSMPPAPSPPAALPAPPNERGMIDAERFRRQIRQSHSRSLAL